MASRRTATAAAAGQNAAPTPAHYAGHLGDPRAERQLRRAIGIVGAVVLPFAGIWFAIAMAIGDTPLAGVAVVAIVYATWLVFECRRSQHGAGSALAIRIAIATYGTIVAVVTIEPPLGIAMATAATVPSVLALVHVDRRTVLRLLMIGAGVGTYAALAGALLPWGFRLPGVLGLALPTSTLVIAYAAFQIHLWNASSQMTATANELTAALDLTREVAHTLDPKVAGGIIARHIARAAEVADCALSMWDRDGDRVTTFAFYPPEMLGIAEHYDLAEFPATRRVLMTGEPCFVDIADPASDPQELAYLGSVAQRSMVILPLVVRGESIGILELTSRESAVFSDRSVALAQLLAREAAVSLENARLYDEIHEQAFRDSLTGLANRRLFLDRISHVLDRLRGRSAHRVAVLFMDVDNFKLLNDRFGHTVGDDVLRAIGERLRLAIRPGDTAARLGGDEFAVLLEDVDGSGEALLVAERLLTSLAAPVPLASAAPQMGVSIGVALSGVAGDSADDLLRNADIAMYAAKAAGRGRIELFEPEHLLKAAARSDLDARLRGAVDRDELRLEYQPIVDLANGTRRVIGLEALVRWDPVGQPTQMPETFIGLAEESGEIMAIGRWVLHEACRQASVWQHAHDLPRLRINVNLSARQFSDPGLTGMVATALRDSGLPPGCLTLEITESTLMARTRDTIDRVRDLRSMGVRISIDDFGTGYSSLGYLQAFELDEMKIDRSFVSPASTAGTPRVISRAIVELAKALGLEMVVEGIESTAQARWFRSLGCQFAQGFHYSEPLRPVEASDYLAAHRDTVAPAGITKLEDRRRRGEVAAG
jgi:diguanylate cyclase (GGDEF)-like protein